MWKKIIIYLGTMILMINLALATPYVSYEGYAKDLKYKIFPVLGSYLGNMYLRDFVYTKPSAECVKDINSCLALEVYWRAGVGLDEGILRYELYKGQEVKVENDIFTLRWEGNIVTTSPNSISIDETKTEIKFQVIFNNLDFFKYERSLIRIDNTYYFDANSNIFLKTDQLEVMFNKPQPLILYTNIDASGMEYIINWDDGQIEHGYKQSAILQYSGTDRTTIPITKRAGLAKLYARRYIQPYTNDGTTKRFFLTPFETYEFKFVDDIVQWYNTETIKCPTGNECGTGGRCDNSNIVINGVNTQLRFCRQIIPFGFQQGFEITEPINLPQPRNWNEILQQIKIW